MAHGQLHVLLQDAPYTDDPLALFAALTHTGDNSMLLESAEIDTKAGTQSLLMLDACVRLVCHGRTVTLTALNNNGQPALDLVAAALGGERTEQQLTVTFGESDSNLDEDSRLKAPSVLETLRLILTRFEADLGQQHVFLAGTFAYDLIASFEDLAEVPEGINRCPDFCFYLAETLITLDYKQEQCHLSAALQKSVLNKPKVSVYYEVDPAPYSVGPNSFIGTLITKAGGQTIIPAKLGDFPKIDPELILPANPQVMIGLDLSEAKKRPGWANLNAVRSGRVYQPTPEERDALSRPGPRLPDALRALIRVVQGK